MKTHWTSPLNLVLGDPALKLEYPRLQENYVSLRCTNVMQNEIRWVYLNIDLPAYIDLHEISLGYEVADADAYIDHVKLIEVGKVPGNEIVVYEDCKNLTSLSPTIAKLSLPNPIKITEEKSFTLAIGCRFNQISTKEKRIIRISSVGLNYISHQDFTSSHMFMVDIAEQYAGLADAVNDISSKDEVSWLIRSRHVIDKNIEIPRHVELHFVGGGEFAVINDATLTIHGGIQAGIQKIFDVFDPNTGAITGEVRLLNMPRVLPQWWGRSPVLISRFRLIHRLKDPNEKNYIVVSSEKDGGDIWYQGPIGKQYPEPNYPNREASSFYGPPINSNTPAATIWISVYPKRESLENWLVSLPLQQFSFVSSDPDQITSFGPSEPITSLIAQKMDDVENWSPAIQAAIRTRSKNGALNTDGTWCYIPAGNYYCHDTIHLDTAGKLSGAGKRATFLEFRGNIDGLKVEGQHTGEVKYRTGAFSLIENMYLRPVNRNNAEKFLIHFTFFPSEIKWDKGHGINARSRCYLRNIYVHGFGGDGIRIDSMNYPHESDKAENANVSSVISCTMEHCMGDGVHFLGTDSHGGNTINCEVRKCGGAGLSDESKFGNLHLGFVTNYSGGPAYKVVKPPEWIPPGGTDFSTNYATMVNCYIEGDPPPKHHMPYLRSRVLVVGGNLSLWANRPENPISKIVSNFEGRSKLIFGDMHHATGEQITRGSISDGISMLALKDHRDGTTAAQLELDVTAGSGGATIPPRGQFYADDGFRKIYFYATNAVDINIPSGQTQKVVVKAMKAGGMGNLKDGMVTHVATVADDGIQPQWEVKGVEKVNNPVSLDYYGADPNQNDNNIKGEPGLWRNDLIYIPVPDGYDRNKGNDDSGKYLMKYREMSPTSPTYFPFFWTGEKNYYQKPGQFGFGNSIADSRYFATQFQSDDLLPSDPNNPGQNERVFQFNGVTHILVTFFSYGGQALDEDKFLCIPDFRCASDKVEIVAKWLDKSGPNGAKVYNVKVRNNDTVNAHHVDIGLLLIRRAEHY
jgi:hypothetical protein